MYPIETVASIGENEHLIRSKACRIQTGSNMVTNLGPTHVVSYTLRNPASTTGNAKAFAERQMIGTYLDLGIAGTISAKNVATIAQG